MINGLKVAGVDINRGKRCSVRDSRSPTAAAFAALVEKAKKALNK